MKKAREELDIKAADLDSFLLWKVFQKIIRSESLSLFLLKVIFGGISFFLMILIHILFESFLR